MTDLRTSTAELNALLARTTFLRAGGLVVQACAPGECVVRVPFSERIERPGGVVSGIAVMGAADVAMWLAIMTHRGTEENWVTADMKTAFLRGGRREDLFCTARILKIGNRSAYGTVETIGDASGLLAHHVLTYIKVPT
jgi:uncharacterized protein (TIGR00369 family)